MSFFARARSWIRASSRRAVFEREMQDEMRTHLELYQADLRSRGVPDAEAMRAGSIRPEYFIVAFADARGDVAESSERNNFRVLAIVIGA